jgi:hypothetical protein
MTAHDFSSGRSCKRVDPDVLLECISDPFGSGVDPEYLIHRNNPEMR